MGQEFDSFARGFFGMQDLRMRQQQQTHAFAMDAVEQAIRQASLQNQSDYQNWQMRHGDESNQIGRDTLDFNRTKEQFDQRESIRKGFTGAFEGQFERGNMPLGQSLDFARGLYPGAMPDSDIEAIIQGAIQQASAQKFGNPALITGGGYQEPKLDPSGRAPAPLPPIPYALPDKNSPQPMATPSGGAMAEPGVYPVATREEALGGYSPAGQAAIAYKNAQAAAIPTRLDQGQQRIDIQRDVAAIRQQEADQKGQDIIWKHVDRNAMLDFRQNVQGYREQHDVILDRIKQQQANASTMRAKAYDKHVGAMVEAGGVARKSLIPVWSKIVTMNGQIDRAERDLIESITANEKLAATSLYPDVQDKAKATAEGARRALEMLKAQDVYKDVKGYTDENGEEQTGLYRKYGSLLADLPDNTKTRPNGKPITAPRAGASTTPAKSGPSAGGYKINGKPVSKAMYDYFIRHGGR